MMNINFFLSTFFFCISLSTSTYSQDSEPSPISISDIQKGLTDLGYMRAVLLEHGFQLQSEETEDKHIHEYWHIPNPDNSFGSFAVFQVNKGKSVTSSKELTFCSFRYSTRKQIHPLYFNAMREDVYKNFPIKKSKDITVTTTKADNKETKKDYKLEYYSATSPIVVSLDDNGNWAGFGYSLTVTRSLINSGSRRVNTSKK